MEVHRVFILLRPPPHQHRGEIAAAAEPALARITMRVFICAVGAFGFLGWAMKEMPEAQKRGSLSAPGICAANSLGKRAMHGRGMAADLLEHAA